MQEFTAPITGNYKLEVWGASGGNYDDLGIGGKGGYSKGIGYILENTIISICVGGIGRFNGYNGGGDPHNILAGGGATHIAQNNRGTLQDYINNKDEVYIVAGGGGGCDTHGIGGYGGGENGGDGIGDDEGSSYPGTGGTQSTGGTGGNSGVFGRGGNSLWWGNDSGGGGGGGWYGGGGSENRASPGGGGSGHIGTMLTNGATIAGDQTFPSPSGGTETGHSGYGYAIITWQQLPQ